MEHEVAGEDERSRRHQYPRPAKTPFNSHPSGTVRSGTFASKVQPIKVGVMGRGPGAPSALSSGGAQQVEGDCSSPRSLLARWIEMRLFLTVWAGQLL